MKLSHLKSVLPQRADFRVSFQLPDGWRVPARAHVTRGARIDKQFLDCGGTLRADSKGRLQTRV
ncbi:MAG TPA: hypothetical protein VNO52_18980, partial [Methylomirabilota bacterium]|nr:hypothetical protein [Methylomirabilota bacterium]